MAPPFLLLWTNILDVIFGSSLPHHHIQSISKYWLYLKFILNLIASHVLRLFLMSPNTWALQQPPLTPVSHISPLTLRDQITPWPPQNLQWLPITPTIKFKLKTVPLDPVVDGMCMLFWPPCVLLLSVCAFLAILPQSHWTCSRCPHAHHPGSCLTAFSVALPSAWDTDLTGLLLCGFSSFSSLLKCHLSAETLPDHATQRSLFPIPIHSLLHSALFSSDYLFIISTVM